MKRPVSYYVWTIVLGLIVVPVGVGLWSLLASILLATGAWWPTWVASGLALVGVYALWYRRGRVQKRPASGLAALLPVAIPPAYFLVAWVVCFAISPGNPVGYFAYPGLPWSLLNLQAALTAQWLMVPFALVGVLAATLLGYALGYRARRRAPDNPGWGTRSARIGLIGTIAASVALTGGAAYQIGAREAYLNLPQVTDQLDLGVYVPFSPDNRLATPASAPTLSITSDFPKLDGATALYPVYAAAAQAVYAYPAGSALTLAKEDVVCSTTPGAYDALIAGRVDAIFVAAPSAQQKAAAAAAGVDLVLTPIGREGFVFFVNADNPVTGLTLEQIRGIYSRTITNWAEIGGKNQPIQAYQRPEGSGSQTAMLGQVMKDTPIAEPLREEVAMGMGDVLHDVATYRNTGAAIGYSFRWYATVMNANPAIRLLDINGVAPTAENIRNGTYPLTSQFYVVTAGPPTGNTATFIDWLQGAEGQALIERVGYVGL